MKKFVSLLIAIFVLSLGQALADDTALVELSEQLMGQACAAHQAATPEPCSCSCERPPRFRNWQLRKTMKDIRKIARSFRKRAVKGKAHSLVGRLKVKRLVANLQTANFLVLNDAARGLEAFPAAWEAARATIAQIVAEMGCGCDCGDGCGRCGDGCGGDCGDGCGGDQGGNKSR